MKKFDQYVIHLRILSRAFDEDLTNDFIVSGIIDKYYTINEQVRDFA